MGHEQKVGSGKADGSAIAKVVRWFAELHDGERSNERADVSGEAMDAALIVTEGLSMQAERTRWTSIGSILTKCETIADMVGKARDERLDTVLVAETEKIFLRDWKKYGRGNPSSIRVVRTVPLPLPTDELVGYPEIDDRPLFQMGVDGEGKNPTALYVRRYAEVPSPKGPLYNDSLEIFYTPLALGDASPRLFRNIEDALDASPFLTAPLAGEGGWPTLPTDHV